MPPATLPMHKQALTDNCSVLSCLTLSTPDDVASPTPLRDDSVILGLLFLFFGWLVWLRFGSFLKVHSYISLQVPLEFIH